MRVFWIWAKLPSTGSSRAPAHRNREKKATEWIDAANSKQQQTLPISPCYAAACFMWVHTHRPTGEHTNLVSSLAFSPFPWASLAWFCIFMEVGFPFAEKIYVLQSQQQKQQRGPTGLVRIDPSFAVECNINEKVVGRRSHLEQQTVPFCFWFLLIRGYGPCKHELLGGNFGCVERKYWTFRLDS